MIGAFGVGVAPLHSHNVRDEVAPHPPPGAQPFITADARSRWPRGTAELMPYPIAVHQGKPDSAIASRVPRWLLMVLTLTALASWLGVHCADDMALHLTSASTSASTSAVHLHDAGSGTAGPGTVTSGEAAASHRSGPANEHCQIVIKTATGCVTAGLEPPDEITTYQAGTLHIRMPAAARPVADVTLIALGISRT